MKGCFQRKFILKSVSKPEYNRIGDNHLSKLSNMAKTDYQSIDEYHRTFPKDIEVRMQSIRDLVHQIVPDVKEAISYQIPVFKIGKHPLIYYSAYPKHISLSSPWSDRFRVEFSKQLEDYKVSRSVIQFPHGKALPMDFIEQILKFRKKEIEE